MVYYCGEVIAAIKGRGSALPASIGPFIMFSSGVNSGLHVNFWRHRRIELDSCRLIPEDTGPIYLGIMMDDYGEVFAAFKGRGHALLATYFELVFLERFQMGQYPGFQDPACYVKIRTPQS